MPLAALVFLFIGSLADASARELQPKTYVSPSGMWSLRVEPLTREGTGEADYTLTGGGSEAWKARHPFALCDVSVTDDGRVAGYAYVEKKPGAHFHSLHVALLSPTGEVLLDEVHLRKWSQALGMHGAPRPIALGLFVQPELERFVVRIADEPPYIDGESWWAYDLRTGEPLVQERPMLAVEGVLEILDLWEVRAVPQTPLLLLHWCRKHFGTEPDAVGAVFQLLDAERHPVWRLDLPHDYQATKGLADEIESRGAILATDALHFELRHVAEGMRVSYTIAAETDGWRVSEAGRVPYREVGFSHSGSVGLFQPILLREVALGVAPPPKGEIRDVRAFGFDAESRLRFVRSEEEGFSLVLLTPSGDSRRVSRVPVSHVPTDVVVGDEIQWFPISAPDWIVVTRDFDDGASARGWRVNARAWRLNEETGALRELPDFSGQDVQRIVELSGGRLLVLSSWDFESFTVSTLSACDGTGKTLWTMEEDDDHEDPAFLYSPADVAVTTDDKVVVLDSVRNSLQVFSDQGIYLETIELAPVWGDRLGAFSSIVADSDGGVMIEKGGLTAELWRMRLDGSVRAKLEARTEQHASNARVAPDGRVWTTDYYEFVRLDESGVVDLQVGAPAMIEWLESPDFTSIDSTFGRISIVDDRTGAVHVFDGAGKRVLLCEPVEGGSKLPFLRIRSDSSGGLLVGSYTWNYLRFGSDGASRGGGSLKGSKAAFVPGRAAYWGVVKDEIARFSETGDVELSLPKLPDGRWWSSIEELTVAPDGRLAVLGRSDTGGVVALFDPDGKPLGQHALPKGRPPEHIAYVGSWVLLSANSKEVWLLDTRNGRVLSLDFGTQVGDDTYTEWGLDPSGTELWGAQPGSRRLLEFSLPD